MQGQARAPAAGTVLNALATGTGSAFAIDEYVSATVTLESASGVDGRISGAPDADTELIERCVELVVERYGDGQGGIVETESEVPLAAGLKSSSAAANATVLATLSALDAMAALDPIDAARLGVEAARDAGVTITGAFDDASASMLGGVTVTDNEADELLEREPVDWDVLVWTPPERAYSADADVDRCRRIAPIADLIADVALDGDYGRAMSVNGLAFCSALDFPTEPIIEALPTANGASLSGTGSSYTAVGNRTALEQIAKRWRERDGDTWFTSTQTAGATVT
ncbi:MAG: shikimate kinase [Salinirussus sp.]